jgi:hypothetical protein
MKSKAWYIKFPIDPFALGPVRFEKPVGERAVRKWTREWDHLKRLPRGFECWPTND